MAVIPVVIVLATTMELSDIGIAMPNHKVFEAALTNPVNLAIIALSLMIILLLVLDAVYTIIKYTVYSNKQIKLKDKPMELPIKMLQPLTMKEKKIWTCLSRCKRSPQNGGSRIFIFGIIHFYGIATIIHGCTLYDRLLISIFNKYGKDRTKEWQQS